MRVSPKVAIITRTKDRPVFLRRAIRSVLAQGFSDWVHVIVNDGGDRQPVDLLVAFHAEAYAGRVKVVHHDRSQGMQNASNAGLAASDSTYVVIHDDDDTWYPDFLEKTVGFLDGQGADSLVQAVVTQSTQIVEEISLSGEIIEISRTGYYPFDFVNLGEMRRRNLFPPIALLYRRSVHARVGLFRQEFDVLGDHDFNLRLLRHFEIGVLPTFHAYYHWRHGSHGNTVTRGRGVHRRMLNRMKNAYERELLDDPASAVGDLDAVEFPKPDGADPVPFRLRAAEPAGPRAMPDFLKAYDFDILSLDVFDTVLKRRCHHPKDVFRFLEERAVSQLGLPQLPYALAREEAERKARLDHGREVTLEEIHAVLQQACGLKAAQSRSLMQLELEIETELLYADPRWLRVYEDARTAGVRVIFLSDMYLSGAQIAAFLERCGFAAPEVYASSELRRTKHEGTLQPEVARRLGVAPGRILHVGDNFHGDLLGSRQAGWQALHWSREFNYTPWYAQVEPFQYDAADRLSARIMGEVSRLGLLDPLPGDALMQRLGREVAGPLYLAYMLWVLRAARRDGVRKLLLIGRDGYYWEKTLALLAERQDPGLEFAYLHASRKVFNFASFFTLDDEALEFLLTPNPALKVRDYIDRTGLVSGHHLDAIAQAGFDDPEAVLTTEMGGQFLDDATPRKLITLFQLLRPELERLFAEDRAGTLRVLQEAGYRHEDCAFVDIGWNGSCIRPVTRLLGLQEGVKARGYFFGTWKEAEKGARRVDLNSYFIHLGEPADRFQLVRESVNLIESCHAAPFPTLLAFHTEGEQVVPKFASTLRSGFSIDQQRELWQGAEAFLRAILDGGLPATGDRDGLCYISLVLHRILREPSPAEVRAWGPVLHSDGFGLEVYKPLVEPVASDLGGEQLMEAYRASNWKRGFLASLAENQRQFVLERIQPARAKSVEELQADLNWKTMQADLLWAEQERFKWEAGHLREETGRLNSEVERLRGEVGKLRGDLDWKIKQTEELWGDKERAGWEANELRKKFDETWGEKERYKWEAGDLRQKFDQAWAEKERLNWEAGNLKETVASLEAGIQRLEAEKAAADATVTELGQLRQRLEAELAELQSDKQRVEGEYAALQSRLAELGQRLAEVESERDHFRGLLHQRLKLLRIVLGGHIPGK